jgi:dTDP-4-amino-4,6-dideoxyglucose formyltransferase
MATQPSLGVSIVSDNLELSEYVCKAIGEAGMPCAVQVFTSHRTDCSLWPDHLGASQISMKDSESIEMLVSTSSLVISVHSKQLFPESLFSRVKCINIHPGLNPHNRGWFPQVFSILNKLPLGATIHEIDEHIDHGRIISQLRVETLASDTSLSLYRKVVAAEKELVDKTMSSLVRGAWKSFSPSNSGNLNSYSDYKKLCQLDLSSVGTLAAHIDLLRALSHPPYKNGYFLDESGRKIFVEVSLTKEYSSP